MTKTPQEQLDELSAFTRTATQADPNGIFWRNIYDNGTATGYITELKAVTGRHLVFEAEQRAHEITAHEAHELARLLIIAAHLVYLQDLEPRFAAIVSEDIPAIELQMTDDDQKLPYLPGENFDLILGPHTVYAAGHDADLPELDKRKIRYPVPTLLDEADTLLSAVHVYVDAATKVRPEHTDSADADDDSPGSEKQK